MDRLGPGELIVEEVSLVLVGVGHDRRVSNEVFQFRQAISNAQDRVFVVEVDGGLEGESVQRGANVGQAKGGMIDHDVGAALGAEAAFAYLAALKAAERFGALRDLDGLRFPQGKDGDGRAGIGPATVTMAVAHVERLAARLDRHRPAITTSSISLSHGVSNILAASWIPDFSTLTQAPARFREGGRSRR